MNSSDINTQDYINPSVDSERMRRSRPASTRTSDEKQSRRRPIPDPEGPRRPQRRKKSDTVSFFRDYRTHLAFGIFLCLLGFVMAITCISFLSNHSADQSVVLNRSVQEIVEAGDTVENVGGPAGAKIAEWLLVDTFGIGSFVLAFYVFVIGLAVIRIHKVEFFGFSFRCLFSAAALSIIAGLIGFNRDTLFHLGGKHGYEINSLLLQYSSELGAYCVSLLLAGILIAIFLNPLKKFFGLLSKVMKRKKLEKATVSDMEIKPENVASLDDLENNDEPEMPAVVPPTEPVVVEPAPEEDASTAEQTGIQEIPQPGLDAFESPEEEDTVVETEEPKEQTFDKIPVRNETPITVEQQETPNPHRIVSEPGEPEMVIVKHETDSEPVVDPQAPIRHGDHISIDQPYDVRAAHSNYVFPSTELLNEGSQTVEINEAEQIANKNLIVEALRSYNIAIQRIEATVGPTVTLYEIVPEQGTRIAKIKSLEDDIAMSLSALGIRIIAPIPGKGTVGIEVPNRKPQIVSMRTVLESKAFANNKMELPIALGATISNNIYITDLTKMPHLLVAGATGQGKSVGLNCIIASLLYSKHPDELKFVLVDPKTVEFSLFESINKQYLAKLPDEEKAVITEPSKVVDTLNSLCVEMDNRYQLLSDAMTRNIKEYNARFVQRQLNPENGHRFLPYIVVIVDEYADLVMVAGKEVAVPIARIAQKARAVGIHMIIATQRPSTDVITGMIKANFIARIAFKVTQSVDSKTILDRPGAQRLIGRGDMLIMLNGIVERVQCAFIDTPEVEAICHYIGSQQGFTSCYLLPEPPAADGSEPSGNTDYGAMTEEFKRCALFISTQSQASITSLQRKFEIGFNKAGRFMDQMQQMGIVGPAKGAKPRDVLMTPDEVQRLFE
jgi:S-DNA-T family DNA segregation ATPase FtsK/SpoIIIE